MLTGPERDHANPGFFLYTFLNLKKLWNRGNLSFWPFNLSFFEFGLSFFRAYLVNLSKNRGNLGFSTKIPEFFRKNLSFFRPEFFAKCPIKKPAIVPHCGYTISICRVGLVYCI